MSQPWPITTERLRVIDPSGGEVYIDGGSTATSAIGSTGTLDVTAAGAMTVQPAAHASAAGYEAKLQGGQGAATFAGGDCVLQLGAPGAGSTTHGDVPIRNGTGVEIGSLGRYAGGDSLQITGNNAAVLSSGQILALSTSQLQLSASSGFINLRPGANNNILRQNNAAVNLGIVTDRSLVTSTSGLQTVGTFTTVSNSVYKCRITFTWSNDTDDTGGGADVYLTVRDVAGTLTQIGTTYVDPNTFASDDTGMSTTATVSADVSGTTIRARCTPADTDARNIAASFHLERAVLT